MKYTKHWKHFNFDQRKIIANGLSKGLKCFEIAQLLMVDPTSVSKEIKRNRTLHDEGKRMSQNNCNVQNRYPYVCHKCTKRYGKCDQKRYVYRAEDAQSLAKERLVKSRSGINLTPQEFEYLDSIIKTGIQQKQSIYHILKHHPDVNSGVSSVYRYIDEGFLTTKAMDLPRKVRMKKRKTNKKYDYSTSKTDRGNRTYLDYLSFKHHNQGLYASQMDFLGKVKTDSKTILTLTIPELQFVLLILLENETQQAVVDCFNRLEAQLGLEGFQLIFPFILTDRDPAFIDYLALESAALTGEKRTHLFYCDAFNSSQKGHVENMNQQLRAFFPKKASKQHLTQERILHINLQLLERRIRSLSGATPKEAFIHVYGEDLFYQLLNLI